MTTADARYDEKDAVRDCERKISSDRRVDDFYAIKVHDERHHSFHVEGKAAMRNAKDPFFSCQVIHKEVVSWRIERRSRDNGIPLTGAGLLGAAIAPVIASRARASDAHQDSRERYASGHGSAFDDQRYLEEECRRAVIGHLEYGHAEVETLDLGRYHFNGRRLHGDGTLKFRHGDRPGRQLTFTCAFDRRGRIIDGDYHYY